MKRFALAVAGASLAALIAAPAWAQSAKFAATWNDNVVELSVVDYPGIDPVCTGEDGGTGTQADPCFVAQGEMAEIHVAQNMELLLGVSGQIGIVTITDAKGNSGTTSTAKAFGQAEVTVHLENQATGEVIYTAPGTVVFASRLQELSVSSSDDTDVLVELKIKTTAAHHFNFLGVDVPQGTYDIIATFDLTAFAEATGLDPTKAKAKVILGPRVVTAQEVRAVKDSIMEP